MRPLLHLLGVAVVALSIAWSVQDQSDAEAVCAADYAAFRIDADATRGDGPAARRALLERVRALASRHEGVAPRCLANLYEYEAYLYVMDERFEAVARLLGPYLDGAGQQAPAPARVRLGISLGYALNQIGQSRDAARAYFEAGGLAQQTDAHMGARALIEAGTIARAMGEEAAAAGYLRSALDLVDDSLAAHPTLAATKGHALVSLALLLDVQYENAPTASARDSLRARLEAVTAEALTVLPSEAQWVGFRAIATNFHALAAALDGRFAEARARLAPSAALAIQAGSQLPKALLDTYWIQGRILDMAGDLPGARAALGLAYDEAVRLESTTDEGLMLDALGRVAEQEQAWDEAAQHYTTAIERYETNRDRLGLDDWSSSAFATMQAPYRGLVRVRLAQGRPAEAFFVLDQTRARYLRDLRHHLDVRRTMSPDTRARADSLADVLGRVRSAYARAASGPELARLRERTSALQGEMERITAAPRRAEATVDLGALQATLRDRDRTLLAYAIDARGSHVFVVRPDTLVAVALPGTPEEIREALAAAGAPWRDGSAEPAFDLGALYRLHELLVAPVASWVDTPGVVVVPDAEIATIPFGMLLTGPANDFATAPYLLRDWSISTELAAALVGREPAAGTPTLDVLAFGRSTFASDRSSWTGGDLNYVPQEIGEVSRYRGSRAFLDEEATEERFESLAGSARVLHVASHAEANPTLPLYSRIALRGGGDQDGTLHLYEILERPLIADLVVLSGCSTAGSSRRDGEGLVGLQYGMRAAGSAASLATLWAVADEATAELMDGFYDGLAQGLGKDEALRQTQLAYLASRAGLAASPYFWAAPVLSGSPAPVPLRRPLPWLWIGLGLAAAGALAVGARCRRGPD